MNRLRQQGLGSRLLLSIALALAAPALWAQDDGAGAAEDAAAPSSPAPERAPAPDDSKAADSSAPAAPAGASRTDDDEFVPTEELDADEEVTFPVGI